MTKPSNTWVLLARVVRPQGRKGEVLADLFTDFPQTFSRRGQLFLRPPAGPAQADPSEANVESHWLHKGRVVLKFSHIDSITQAENLRGFDLVTPREARIPLEGDAVYVSDLLGLSVVDVTIGSGEVAGEIIEVEPEGAGHAMLVIRTPKGDELLIPFVRAYLRKVDTEGKRLEMELPPGLFTAQAPLTEEESLQQSQNGEETE